MLLHHQMIYQFSFCSLFLPIKKLFWKLLIIIFLAWQKHFLGWTDVKNLSEIVYKGTKYVYNTSTFYDSCETPIVKLFKVLADLISTDFVHGTWNFLLQLWNNFNWNNFQKQRIFAYFQWYTYLLRLVRFKCHIIGSFHQK